MAEVGCPYCGRGTSISVAQNRELYDVRRRGDSPKWPWERNPAMRTVVRKCGNPACGETFCIDIHNPFLPDAGRI